MIAVFVAAQLVSKAPAGPSWRPVLSVVEVNAHPDRLDGQEIELEGYTDVGPEWHYIYQSRALQEEFERRAVAGDRTLRPEAYDHDCLTIANPEFFRRPGRDGLLQRTLRLKGVLRAHWSEGNHPDPWGCGVAAIFVKSARAVHRSTK